jgi:hypothetical protein
MIASRMSVAFFCAGVGRVFDFTFAIVSIVKD